jgi:hypothetical protein
VPNRCFGAAKETRSRKIVEYFVGLVAHHTRDEQDLPKGASTWVLGAIKLDGGGL